MQLPTIATDDAAAARRAYLEYRAAFKVTRAAEDEMAARCYRQLSLGRRLLSVGSALREAGADADGRPRLALARADQSYAYLEAGPHGVWFGPERWRPSRPNRSLWFAFPDDIGCTPQPRGRYRSIVPLVPPALRPRDALANYHVLWEPVWEVDPEPPRDPALLKRLDVDLWAVLAVWDLTDVERLALGLRSRQPSGYR